MKRYFFLIITSLFLFSCHKQTATTTTDEAEEQSAVTEIRYEYGIAVDSFRIVQGQVRQGQTLGGILREAGASPATIAQLNQIDREQFDVRSIRAGKPWLAFYQPDSVLVYWVYQRTPIESIVLHVGDSLHVEKQQKEVRHEPRRADVTIHSSLWNALVDAHISTQLAIDLSEIYAWTIDFFGLQQGDRFVVLYDELMVDSTSVGLGQITAAAYHNGGKTQYAFFFDSNNLTSNSDSVLTSNSDSGLTSVNGYFDETGKSLRKTFLKAPLNYKRISSTFSYARKHPIFKTVRPHTGVDYAAPAGTPVVALGDGKVIEKGYKGGGGNTVKIKHNSVYTTAYLHLSKFGDIQVGKNVKQGEVIGYVGSTGNSTGPHLDFRVWENGTPVNPLTLESPSAEPIPEVYQQAYDSVVLVLKKQLHD